MGKQQDGGGWEVVQAPKTIKFQKRQERSEQEAAERQADLNSGKLSGKDAASDKFTGKKKVDAFKKAGEEVLPQFDPLAKAAFDPSSKFSVGGKKKSAAAPVVEEEVKKGMTEEEKAAAKKERKKEKAKEIKVQAKKESLNKAVYADKLSEHVPQRILDGIAELPSRYVNRHKDQLTTTREFLDLYLPAECVLTEDYKTRSREERLEFPLSFQKSDKLMKVIEPIMKPIEDIKMLSAFVRDCVLNAFGRLNGASRPDDGKSFLGTRLMIQYILRIRPDALSNAVDEMEALFQTDETDKMTPNAAINFAWVMAQVRAPRELPNLVKSWGRVFVPRISGEGKGAVVDAGFALASIYGRVAEKQYPGQEKEKMKWRLNEKNSDPITTDQLVAMVKLSYAKNNRVNTTIKKLVAPFSILFTNQSSSRHWLKLAQNLLPFPDAQEQTLWLLTEGLVRDDSPKGSMQVWGDSYLLLVRESVLILTYMAKQQKELQSRANGEALETVFTAIKEKSEAVLRGEVKLEGKKQNRAVITTEDVERVLQLLNKTSALTKAKKVVEKPAKKAAPAAVAKGGKAASQEAGGSVIGSFLKFIFILVILAVAFVYVALPFLPEEQQRLVLQLKQEYQDVATTAILKVLKE